MPESRSAIRSALARQQCVLEFVPLWPSRLRRGVLNRSHPLMASRSCKTGALPQYRRIDFSYVSIGEISYDVITMPSRFSRCIRLWKSANDPLNRMAEPTRRFSPNQGANAVSDSRSTCVGNAWPDPLWGDRSGAKHR